MIEYAKQILPKVSAWKELFRKELIKCVEWSGPDNRDEIFNWCYRHYAGLYSDVLEEVFPYRMEKFIRFKRMAKPKITTSISVYRKPDFVNT